LHIIETLIKTWISEVELLMRKRLFDISPQRAC
jgi:hypothetical protein